MILAILNLIVSLMSHIIPKSADKKYVLNCCLLQSSVAYIH